VAFRYQRQSRGTQGTLAQVISVSGLLTQTTVGNPGVLPDPVPHLLQGLVPGVFRFSQFLQGHQLCLPRQATLVLIWTTDPLRHFCNACNMSGQTVAEDLEAISLKLFSLEVRELGCAKFRPLVVTRFDMNWDEDTRRESGLPPFCCYCADHSKISEYVFVIRSLCLLSWLVDCRGSHSG